MMKEQIIDIDKKKLTQINGGEDGDFAYQVGRFVVHSTLGRLTGGLSNVWWLIKNVNWE